MARVIAIKTGAIAIKFFGQEASDCYKDRSNMASDCYKDRSNMASDCYKDRSNMEP